MEVLILFERVLVLVVLAGDDVERALLGQQGVIAVRQVNDFSEALEEMLGMIDGVMGIVPGMIGTMQATESIKMITGIGNVAFGKLVTYDALTNTMNSFKIPAPC